MPSNTLILKVDTAPDGAVRICLHGADCPPLRTISEGSSAESLRDLELGWTDGDEGDFGRRSRQIGAVLFPPDVRAELTRRAVEATGRLSLLLFANDLVLSRISWETAWFESARPETVPSGELALHPAFDPIRVNSLDAVEPAPESRLNVLIACADPARGRYGALPGAEAEIAAIESALGRRRIPFETLRHATPTALARRLAALRPTALHFIGHGASLASGYALILEGDRPEAYTPLYADEASRLLRDSGVRLTVLSACGSAQAMMSDDYDRSGAAVHLLMQEALNDGSAPVLMRAVFGALSDGATVSDAVREGRQALRGSVDRAAPVLWGARAIGMRFTTETENAPFAVPYLRNRSFIGRADLMSELHGLLSNPDHAAIALVGMPGLGKTQLAAEYAHRFRRSYPGGVYWIDARDMDRVTESFAALDSLFDVPAGLPVAQRAERVRQDIQRSSRASLVIFDNVESADVLDRIPFSPACRALVTARRKGAVEWTCRLLQPVDLEPEAARSLLQSARRADGAAETAALDEIAELVGRLPLALDLLSRYVERHRISFVECRRRLERDRVRTLSASEARAPDALRRHRILDVIESIRDALPPDAIALLAAASTLSGRAVPLGLLRECGGFDDPERYEEALADLRESGIFTEERDDRVSLHELIRGFAFESIPPEERTTALLRSLSALDTALSAANRAWDWSATHAIEGQATHVLGNCDANGLEREAQSLRAELGIYHLQLGEAGAARRGFERGLAIARLAEDGAEEAARFLKLLAEACEPRAIETLRCIREACRTMRRARGKRHADLADYYNTIGFVLKKRESLGRALRFYEMALAINEDCFGRDYAGTAVCLSNIGMLRLVQGDHDEALDRLLEALDIDTRIYGPHSPKVGIRLNNIGMVYAARGEWNRALDSHSRANEIYTGAYGGRHPDTADSRFHMADGLSKIGRATDAAALYGQALDAYLYFDGAGHPRCLETQRRLAALNLDKEES